MLVNTGLTGEAADLIQHYSRLCLCLPGASNGFNLPTGIDQFIYGYL